MIGQIDSFLRRRLTGRDTLQRALHNSFWLFCDQATRMAAGLIVGIWVARYLGPEQYGWLSYALSMVGLASSFASLGVNPIVVRELARQPEQAEGWVKTAIGLKGIGASAAFLVCVLVAWLRGVPAAEVRPLIVVLAVGTLLQVFDAMDLLFQARGELRTSAVIRITGCLAANLVKVILIVAHASLVAFAFATVFELALNAVGWVSAIRRRGIHWFVVSWNGGRARALVLESLPLALSAVAIYAQAYADQLVLGAMLGGAPLGQYAAATRLVTVFAFLPTIVYTVSAPEITRAKRDDPALYRRRLLNLYRTMFGLFLVVGIPLAVLGPFAARLLYGQAYALAATLLPWLALRLFFTNFGLARSIFITNEGMFRFALGTAIVGALANVGLNLWLVPRWSAYGAIVSSLASFAITTFAFEWLDPRTRANFALMARAVALPWRSRIE